MKLIFINSARDWGGAEAWSAHLCTGMAARGHSVLFIGHPEGELCRRLPSRSGLTIEPLRIRGELDPIRVYRLSRIFRRTAPDAVMTYRTRDTKLAVAANALAGRFPLVHTQQAPFPLRDSPVYRLVWRRGVDAMAISSSTMRDLLLRETPWLAGTPIRVIRNGVDVREFRPRPDSRERVRRELGLPSDRFVLSYHGRIEPRKQVDVVIEAVARASRAVPLHALLIGDGPDQETCRHRAEALGAPVRFAGFRADVSRLLAAADAAIHLSVSDTLPHSVLEALASGLPVVVSDAASHTEQVEHEVHGLVVPPRDPEAAAAAIVRLASEEETRLRMAAAARERALAEFDRARMVEDYERYLAEIVSGRARGLPGGHSRGSPDRTSPRPGRS